MELLARFRESLSASPRLAGETLLLEGLCLAQTEDYPQALTKLQLALVQAPDADAAPRAQFLIGWIHLLAQEQQRAEAAFAKVIDKYPGTEYADKAQAMLSGMHDGVFR